MPHPAFNFKALLISHHVLGDIPLYPRTWRHVRSLPFVVFSQTRGSSTCMVYVLGGSGRNLVAKNWCYVPSAVSSRYGLTDEPAFVVGFDSSWILMRIGNRFFYSTLVIIYSSCPEELGRSPSTNDFVNHNA